MIYKFYRLLITKMQRQTSTSLLLHEDKRFIRTVPCFGCSVKRVVSFINRRNKIKTGRFEGRVGQRLDQRCPDGPSRDLWRGKKGCKGERPSSFIWIYLPEVKLDPWTNLAAVDFQPFPTTSTWEDRVNHLRNER